LKPLAERSDHQAEAAGLAVRLLPGLGILEAPVGHKTLMGLEAVAPLGIVGMVGMAVAAALGVLELGVLAAVAVVADLGFTIARGFNTKMGALGVQVGLLASLDLAQLGVAVP